MHGFFIGRMNPIHLGHEAVINHMVKTCGAKNSTAIIGSSNASTSLRHFFSYSERRQLIKQLYPQLNVVGLPDYPTDDEWLLALNDLMHAIAGTSKPGEVIFFGGTHEDVRWFLDAKHTVKIIDRFSGATPVVSATQVRDHLIQGQSLDGLLDPQIITPVQDLFKQRWDIFKQQ